MYQFIVIKLHIKIRLLTKIFKKYFVLDEWNIHDKDCDLKQFAYYPVFLIQFEIETDWNYLYYQLSQYTYDKNVCINLNYKLMLILHLQVDHQ